MARALPAAAEKHTGAGGIAFTRHYVALINQAFRTGRTEELAELTGPTCEICRATIGDIVYAYSRGTIRGGDISVKAIELSDPKGVIANQQVTYSVAKYEEVGRSGQVLHSVPARSESKIVVKLQWTDGAWRVGQVRRLAAKA